MKRVAIIGVFTALGLFSYWLGRSNDEAKPLARVSKSAPAVALKAKPIRVKEEKVSAVAETPKPVGNDEPRAFRDKTELADAVETVDLWSPLALSELSTKLRSSDTEMVSSFFVETLKGSRDKLAERDRILSIADQFQGESLLPFWKDVIERKPPRVSTEVRSDEHPDINVTQELYKAVRALRLLAANDLDAKAYLEQITLDSKLNFDDLILRKQAFFAVKEIDAGASARIIRTLAADDPLISQVIAE